MDTEVFDFSHNCEIEWRLNSLKVFQTANKIKSLVVSVIIPSVKEMGQEMSGYKPTLKLLLLLMFLTKSNK